MKRRDELAGPTMVNMTVQPVKGSAFQHEKRKKKRKPLEGEGLFASRFDIASMFHSFQKKEFVILFLSPLPLVTKLVQFKNSGLTRKCKTREVKEKRNKQQSAKIRQ